jgi:enoyl-CoA hydratase
MNAMAFDVMVPLREALEQISFDNTVRVVVLTGAGEGFCSGADLVDPGYLPIFDGLTVPGISRRAMKVLDDVIRSLRDMHQPVIAAINGPAIGNGDGYPHRCRRGLLPRGGHQQRAHRGRAGAELHLA